MSLTNFLEKRMFQADVIRVVAMMLVIFMHTILNFTIRPDFFATPLWFLLEPVAAFAKTGVLLFFLLSGYLVVVKQRSLHDHIQKLVYRILVPLLFFEALRFGYNAFLSHGTTWQQFVNSEVLRLVSFPSSPLWFLEVLAILYALNPLWQFLFTTGQREVARYITALAFVFALGVTLLSYLFEGLPVLFTTFTGWTSYLCFYLYGGLLRKQWVTLPSWSASGMMMVGIAATMVGDYVASAARAAGDPAWWTQYTGSYLSFPVTLAALGLFVFLLQSEYAVLFRGRAGEWSKDVVTWIAGLSFGVYLIHMYVVGIFTDILGFDFNKAGLNVYVFNFLNVFLVTTISVACAWGIRRIPRFRMVIGERP